jgi:rhodanese-related sulfurtransferase
MVGILIAEGCASPSASFDVPRVTPEEVRERLEQGGPVLLVFACTPDYPGVPPIPGSMDLATFRANATMLDKDVEVLLYCGCPGDRAAREAAARLVDAGFTRVKIMSGGVYAWIHAGYEVLPRGPKSLGRSR